MNEPASQVTIDNLLSQAGWVRSLAYRLVQDAAEAEDLAQETLLAAIEHPPATSENLRGWFRTVMLHRKFRNYHAARRRAEREQAVAPSEIEPDTSEVVARAEILRRLVDHVLLLPKEHRNVLLLRYFDGLKPKQIAEKLAVPVDTVHYRLKRGSELLREKLGDEEGRNWPLALLPILRWPGQPPLGPPVRRTIPKGSGLVAASVLALAVGAYWLWSGDGAVVVPPADLAALPRPTDMPSGSRGPAGRVASQTADPSGGTAAPAPSADPGVAAALSATAAPKGRTVALQGRIQFEGAADPGEFVVKLTALPAVQMNAGAESREFRSKAQNFTAELPYRDDKGHRIAEWDIQVDHPNYLPGSSRVRMPLPEEAKAGLDVAPILLKQAAFVTGSVNWTPAHAGDVAVVATVLYGRKSERDRKFESADVSVDGRFRLRVEPAKPCAVVAAAPGRAPLAVHLTMGPGETKDVGVMALPAGVRVAGRVTCPFAGFSAKSLVTLVSTRIHDFGESIGSGHFIGWDKDRTTAWRSTVFAEVDADGRFTADGMPPGEFTVNVHPVVGRATTDLVLSVPHTFTAPTDHADVDVRGAELQVRVLAAGRPVAGAGISVAPVVTPKGGQRSAGCAAGPDGWAGVVGVPGATYKVTATAPGYQPAQTRIVAAAEGAAPAVAEVELVPTVPVGAPATASWTVTLKVPGGRAPDVASFGFAEVKSDGTTGSVRHTRDVHGEGGVFLMNDLVPGRWRVEIRPGCEWYDPAGFLTATGGEFTFESGRIVETTIEAAPAGRLVVTAVDPGGAGATAFDFKILDAAGNVLPCKFAKRGANGTSVSDGGVSTVGPTDVFPALAPGRYAVRAETSVAKQLAQTSFPFEIAAGKVTDLVVLLPAR